MAPGLTSGVLRLQTTLTAINGGPFVYNGANLQGPGRQWQLCY